MSGITQSPVAVGQRAVGVDRRARIIALAAVTALSAILIVLVLTLAGSFSGDDAAAPATQQPAVAEPGVRYDGGPEEGTRGASIAPSVDDAFESVGAAGARYDGGPDEGTRGPNW